MVELDNMESAYKYLLKKIRNIKIVKPMNENRYIFAETFEGDKMLITYKRDVFHNFGEQFRHLGYSGVGDTINCNELKEAIKKGVDTIFTIFPNGYIYYIPLVDFLNNSINWINKEGKQVRSISIHQYRRI